MSDGTCIVTGCDRPIYIKSRGLCNRHRQRQERGAPMWPPTTEERFYSKVTEVDSGCWEWGGFVAQDGYGHFALTTDRPVVAHRWAYEHLIAPIPEGLHLDHLCRNRSCVNPWHLEPVPGAVNIRRGVSFSADNARKTHCLRGHPFDAANTYLTPDGRRMCRVCMRARERKYEAKRSR